MTEGSCKGSSRDDFIPSAFYYYSTCLFVKAGTVIGKGMSEYEQLADKIKTRFRAVFPDYYMQTEYVLAIKFGLTEDPYSGEKDVENQKRKVALQ